MIFQFRLKEEQGFSPTQFPTSICSELTLDMVDGFNLEFSGMFFHLDLNNTLTFRGFSIGLLKF